MGVINIHDTISGIYSIENTINGKKYIGESVDIYRRWHEHQQELRDGCHVNLHLQRAWDQYGEYNFIFSIIEECKVCDLAEREKYWIDFYDAFRNGYNQTQGGDGCLGYKHNDVTKEKMKEIKTQQFKDIKNREKLRDAHKFESRPIYQIDFDGNIIKEWESANWAAKTLGYSYARIYEALNHLNRKKTYHKYIWIYVELYNENTFNLSWYINRNWKWKKYYQYDKNYNLIRVWNSSNEICEEGYNKDSVQKVCNRDMTYKGYYWTNKMLDEGRESVGYHNKSSFNGKEDWEKKYEG